VEPNKDTYHKWLGTKCKDTYIDYKAKRATGCKLSTKAKRESWEYFISRLKRDVTGSQRCGFIVFKNQKSEETDRIRVSGITEEQWLAYCEKLLVNGKKGTERGTTVVNEFNQASIEEVENALNSSGRKLPGIDNINMGLWKHGSQTLNVRMLQISNDMDCWKNTRRMRNGISS
jgi:hypothetical protein